MKHLLNGVTIAAALAIATPVWAQAPMTAGAPKAPAATAPKAPAATAPAAPVAKAAAAPMASKQRHHRPMRHMARHGNMGSGDSMTDQLNREELARIQGGGAGPAAMAPARTMPTMPTIESTVPAKIGSPKQP